MQDTDSGSVRQYLIPTVLVLLGFEAGIGFGWLLLRVMDRAIGLGGDLSQFAFVDAFGDDGLGGKPARLELRPFCLLRAFLASAG